MKWRKYIKLIHRDLGYIFAALVIVYSVSGIAVNHVDEWNPNYIIEKKSVLIPSLADSAASEEAMVGHVLNALGVTDSMKGSFRSGPLKIDIFLESRTIAADLETGKVNIENVSSRRVFRETNFLHLNVPKKYWTYIADGFAVALIFLAVTGLFMIRGKNGITGRGKWLVAAGILIPLLFLIIYY